MSGTDCKIPTVPKVLKEGILFKQRDFFKGWRSRWFALDDQCLHYWITKAEKDDMTSRNSIPIGELNIINLFYLFIPTHNQINDYLHVILIIYIFFYR